MRYLIQRKPTLVVAVVSVVAVVLWLSVRPPEAVSVRVLFTDPVSTTETAGLRIHLYDYPEALAGKLFVGANTNPHEFRDPRFKDARNFQMLVLDLRARTLSDRGAFADWPPDRPDELSPDGRHFLGLDFDVRHRIVYDLDSGTSIAEILPVYSRPVMRDGCVLQIARSQDALVIAPLDGTSTRSLRLADMGIPSGFLTALFGDREDSSKVYLWTSRSLVRPDWTTHDDVWKLDLKSGLATSESMTHPLLDHRGRRLLAGMDRRPFGLPDWCEPAIGALRLDRLGFEPPRSEFMRLMAMPMRRVEDERQLEEYNDRLGVWEGEPGARILVCEDSVPVALSPSGDWVLLVGRHEWSEWTTQHVFDPCQWNVAVVDLRTRKVFPVLSIGPLPRPPGLVWLK